MRGTCLCGSVEFELDTNDFKDYLGIQIFWSFCRVRMRTGPHRFGHPRPHAAPRGREPSGATVMVGEHGGVPHAWRDARAIAVVGIGEGAIRRADRVVRRARPARFD
ncbi:protein of unknown function [Burkholderia multivorans]